MTALLSITTLTLATMFALAAATAIHWLLLRVAFHLMRPATLRPATVQPAAVRRVPARTELAEATAGLTRAFVAHR